MRIYNLPEILVAVLTLVVIPTASAQQAGEQLIEKSRCYACHQLSQPSIGPAYQAIAARHGDRKSLMADVLARKIVTGGGGNWGLVPMVPNQWVNLDEARVMAAWILEQIPSRP